MRTSRHLVLRFLLATLPLCPPAYAQGTPPPNAAFPAQATGDRPNTTAPQQSSVSPTPAPQPNGTPPPAASPQGAWVPPSPPPNGPYYGGYGWQPANGPWGGPGWEPHPQRRWYGWETLLVDAPSLTLWFVASSASESSGASDASGGLFLVGFLGYIFGAPVVHAARGHWGKSGASFAFRAGTTLIAVIGAVGCIDETLFRESRCNAGYATLLLVGALGIPASIVVDAAVIAREDVPPGELGRLRVAPWVAQKGRGGGVTLDGSF